MSSALRPVQVWAIEALRSRAALAGRVYTAAPDGESGAYIVVGDQTEVALGVVGDSSDQTVTVHIWSSPSRGSNLEALTLLDEVAAALEGAAADLPGWRVFRVRREFATIIRDTDTGRWHLPARYRVQAIRTGGGGA